MDSGDVRERLEPRRNARITGTEAFRGVVFGGSLRSWPIRARERRSAPSSGDEEGQPASAHERLAARGFGERDEEARGILRDLLVGAPQVDGWSTTS